MARRYQQWLPEVRDVKRIVRYPQPRKVKAQTPKKFELLHAGRFSPEKRQDLIIEVCKKSFFELIWTYIKVFFQQLIKPFNHPLLNFIK